MKRPDYATARKEAGFEWCVAGTQDALRQLAGVPIREFNLKPEACIDAYRRGCPLMRGMFGEDVALPGPATPSISYGHANGLGSKLLFPEGGEVGHTPIYRSLEDGIAALKRPVDFAKAGMAPFYINFKKQMEAAFPGETVGFSYYSGGPLTTAWELRGHDFFTDLFDNPEGTREFLRLTTESILAFHRFMCSVSGEPVINPDGGGMADDIAAMVPPHLWPDLVLPFWEQYYAGRTTGWRSAHVEDLRSQQLRFIEDIGLYRFDPSISPKLNPKIIAAECRVPFGWRLASFHYAGLSEADVRDFVFQAAADGASWVFSYLAADMCDETTARKVRVFIEAGKEVKQMIGRGAGREEVGKLVSATGQVVPRHGVVPGAS